MIRRSLILVGMLAGAALLLAPWITQHAPRLIWNASASVPVGLYLVHPIDRGGSVKRGDLLAIFPPESLAAFLAERGYLPAGVPLIKEVVALPGTEFCRRGVTILIDGEVLGVAQMRDSIGRDLPVWHGCRTLAEGELFLMNRDAADSLDGRYFGPLPLTSAFARLVPIWTDAQGDGRFEWWAPTR